MKINKLTKLLPIFGLLIILIGTIGRAYGQERTLKGRIVDNEKNKLPGVAVFIKGTTYGSASDFDGNYSININDNNTILVFKSLGFVTQEIIVGNRTILNISLVPDENQLEEIIITALGVKKETRKIGYSTQQVKGSELTKAREANPINSLAGKVAGLTVGVSTELLGAPQVVLRGNPGVLYVVDGVPINSNSWNISADDIETYTVLKGANAAALYGFRGQNGAILVTTKKGTKDDRKFSIEYNSSIMFEEGYLAKPAKQSEYGAGNNYQYAFGNDTYDADGSFRRTNVWGPRFEGQNIPQWDSPVDPITGVRQGTPWLAKGVNNLENFMETGIIATNSLSIAASGEKHDLRMSISNNYQKGMVPNTKLNITNFNISAGYNFTDRLKIEGNLNLNIQNSPNVPETSSGPQGYMYSFEVYGSSHWDVRDMRDYYGGIAGVEGVQQQFAEYGRTNNPYFISNEWLKEHQKTDVYGYAKLSYKINDFFDISARTQVTTWNQLRTEKVPFSIISYKPYAAGAGPDLRAGDYREDKRTLFENNSDLLLNFNKDFGDNFNVSAIAGASLRTFRYNSSFVTTDYLIVPGIYSFSNTRFPVKAYSFRSEMEVASAYYTADFSYKNYLTLGVTGRVDWLSTLPKDNRAIFYPSISLSTVVSDYIDLPEAISFMKLRGSYANVKGGLTSSTIGSAYKGVTGLGISNLIGQVNEVTTSYDGPSYNNQNNYNIFNGYANDPAASFSNTLANRSLESYSVTSYEVGLDMKFLRNRLGLDVTYFTSINGPQIFPLEIASSTGFKEQTINGVTTQKNGLEVSLFGSVIKNTDGFNWDVSANWSTYKEKLKDVYNGISSIYLPGPDHVFNVGDRLDGYYGYEFLRSSDRQIIHSSAGVPLKAPRGTNNKRLLGHTNPDFVFGINNKFSYKNLSLSFQFDGRVGGVIYNEAYAYALNAGNQLDLTTGAYGEARRKEWDSTLNGTVAATPAFVGEGVVITNGTPSYDAAGNISNMKELTFAPNEKVTLLKGYVQSVYGGGARVDEAYLNSKTFLKLREFTIGYTFPKELLKNTFIENASVSLVGRNLLYFAETKDFDLDQFPSGYNSTSRSSSKKTILQSPSTRRFGLNINLTF
ncbi:SusC/RagA family TonB-linked outer membrane protein [Polaribacter sp. ALD11]|uniref:SusC/RagA family TonB-linked outer membrane protein n=1 Tax=Polaribacter sp. ALD11 TaxID=2058137 RepID=UPI000C31B705|nr:SusC/RagA family TonB-linked outer membrane protein [Polaribacter sp. ALD11]AUC85494.1 SusC/RagA family TonB-linked outer membrane protein [Polaribacter sp. ALD11]